MRSDTAHATDFAEILQSGESLTSEGTALAVPKKITVGQEPAPPMGFSVEIQMGLLWRTLQEVTNYGDFPDDGA